MAKKIFHGRPILSGKIEGAATVSHIGLNTLSTYKANVIGGVKDKALCTDGDNKDLYNKDLNGAILCLPQTIGSTTGGFVLMGVAKMGLAPKAMLFANHVDSLAIGGLLMADIWMEHRIITIDLLGSEFLEAVKTGDPIKVMEDGTVEVG
ncbi:aconitase X swivel domain-containing protein [Carboxylicivirga taeanensis]|uniref:aconitase X swivel domain-containing protein n=1 Tax=Carboxylicivirga taeanensis TaxID=1416875 RepID=UPI003F6E1478